MVTPSFKSMQPKNEFRGRGRHCCLSVSFIVVHKCLKSRALVL